ncbi:MAG TPA: AI-2E family transporter [Sandaracinaceae bacterium]
MPSLGPPGSRRRRLIFFAVTGTLLVLVLFVFRAVLAPFALGLVIAYVFAPVANAMTRIRIGRARMPKWVAVVIIYVALLGGIAAAIAFGVPRITAETQRLARELPRAVQTVQKEWIPRVESALEQAASLYGAAPEVEPTAPAEQFESIRIVPRPDGSYEVHLPPNGITISPRGENTYRIAVTPRDTEQRDLVQAIREAVSRGVNDTERYAGALIRGVQKFVSTLIGGIFAFFITLMISAYMLITSDRILGFFRSLAAPDKRDRFDDLVNRIDRGLAGVVRGQLLIALVNGVLSGIGFWLADLRYWPILTLIATVLSIIPIFGAIISSIPAVLVGLQDGLGTGLFVLAWIIGIHQLEANLLNPKIMGDAAKVHPVLVVFALLAGEHLFGIAGALLAVPVLSITQSVFLHFREVALGVPKDPALAAQWAEATLDRAPVPDEPSG